jgi:hypothetical protein
LLMFRHGSLSAAVFEKASTMVTMDRDHSQKGEWTGKGAPKSVLDCHKKVEKKNDILASQSVNPSAEETVRPSRQWCPVALDEGPPLQCL